MTAKVSAAKSKRALAATLLMGALATLVVAGTTLSIQYFETFDDDVIGAVPSNLATPGKPVITNTWGSIVGLVTGERSFVQVVAATGSPGNVFRLADKSTGATGLVGATITPAIVPTGSKSFVAKFAVIPLCDGPGQLSCAIIDNDVTPGSGRLAKVTFLPTGKFALNNQIMPGTFEAGHKYQVEMSLSSATGPWKWNVSIVDTTTNVTVLFDLGLPVEDATAKPGRLKFETSDPGRGTFDVDTIDLAAGP